ncbi:UNVERIFIED_CONTAM: Retrovirus-related Pol polyprotein from transposon [Sesamum calycinum]|uniref:Retrovirus-related Pol polyprotein from transposon n=1 Tax=Sesamum calycinum TaxID=2727403 RepID=A0AAW2J8K2_9LAMI
MAKGNEKDMNNFNKLLLLPLSRAIPAQIGTKIHRKLNLTFGALISSHASQINPSLGGGHHGPPSTSPTCTPPWNSAMTPWSLLPCSSYVNEGLSLIIRPNLSVYVIGCWVFLPRLSSIVLFPSSVWISNGNSRCFVILRSARPLVSLSFWSLNSMLPRRFVIAAASDNYFLPTALLPRPSPAHSFPPRPLSPAEMPERRAQGLYFNCDKNFSPDHQCKTKQFLLLLLEEPDPRDLDSLPPPTPSPQLLSSEPFVEQVHFQLSSAVVSGLTFARTLCLHGLISGHPISILVDSGSSYNIIQPRIEAFLALSIEPVASFSVLVGNGESLYCSSLCSVVPLTNHSQLFTVPSYILPIFGVDVVLGAQWLCTLDPFLSDFSTPSMQFYHTAHLLLYWKDDSWCFCVDYRALNAITVRDRFPIPTVNELLDELHGATVVSKLDLRAGYHQIRVPFDDVHKTAFRTVDGHFEFLGMPFGHSNAPSTFQLVINSFFRPLLRRFVLVFFDDILIYSPDWTSHLAHITEVLQLLNDNCFYVTISKCPFGVPSVDYLGHIISTEGVAADPS